MVGPVPPAAIVAGGGGGAGGPRLDPALGPANDALCEAEVFISAPVADGSGDGGAGSPRTAGCCSSGAEFVETPCVAGGDWLILLSSHSNFRIKLMVSSFVRALQNSGSAARREQNHPPYLSED